MQIPAIPENEAERLEALKSLHVLDTPPEERFDRITRIAQAYFGVPIALVSLVDSKRQWFKSKQGLDAPETSRDISFCGHAILGNTEFSIQNALQDSRFADNPLVTDAPNIRSYHGVPLSSPDGQKVGTLCLIDRVPRELNATDLKMLQDLAAMVESELSYSSVLDKAMQAEFGKARLSAVLDTIVDGVISIDQKGDIVSVNPATTRIFGYQQEELIGQNVNMLMPEPYHSEHDDYLKSFQSTGEARIIGIGRQVKGLRKDNSVFPLELSVGKVLQGNEQLFTGIVRDISERITVEQELARFKATLDASLDCVFMFDPENLLFCYVNQGATEQVGYSNEEMLAMSPVDIKPYIDEKQFREMIQPLIDGPDRIISFETVHRHRDGHDIPVDISLQYVHPDSNTPRFVAMVRDISQRKKVDQMKNEFISTVSHELRTPLTSIMGSLGLMQNGVTGTLPEAAQRLINIAYNNSNRLVRLINDILDVEKIESGKMEFHKESINLVDIIRQALEANESYDHERGIKLVMPVLAPQQNTLMVEGDADRLTQVVTNLLSNATKFSPEGSSVNIDISHRENRVTVGVSDRGPGIPQEFRERIFRKFSQADGADTRVRGGSGLGLNICKAILENHGGLINFEDRQQGGTRFFFELDLIGDPAQNEIKQPSDNIHRGRILVCEDDPDVAGLIRIMLQQEGFVVDIASSAERAKRLLSDNKNYRVMTLDLGLADQDGISLIRELRERPDTRKLPIVVVSGSAKEGKAELNGEAVLMLDWITKPVDAKRLVRAVLNAPKINDGDFRILHVEDDTDLANVIKEVLKEHGDITLASTLADARKLIRLKQFDLIILDMSLPDGSGEELLADMKIQNIKTPPIIVFSALETAENLIEQIHTALLKSQATNQDLIDVLENVISQTHN